MLRPPTAAERTVARLRYYAAELAALLIPFRTIRPNGHEELRGLLQDADTRPAIVTQVSRLRSCIAHIRPIYLTHKREVDTWRTEWDTATPKRRHALLHVHLAQLTQGVLTGLVLLSEEAQADAARIVSFLPDAFPATANQWWYTASLSYWQAPAKPADPPLILNAVPLQQLLAGPVPADGPRAGAARSALSPKLTDPTHEHAPKQHQLHS